MLDLVIAKNIRNGMPHYNIVNVGLEIIARNVMPHYNINFLSIVRFL